MDGSKPSWIQSQDQSYDAAKDKPKLTEAIVDALHASSHFCKQFGANMHFLLQRMAISSAKERVRVFLASATVANGEAFAKRLIGLANPKLPARKGEKLHCTSDGVKATVREISPGDVHSTLQNSDGDRSKRTKVVVFVNRNISESVARKCMDADVLGRRARVLVFVRSKVQSKTILYRMGRKYVPTGRFMVVYDASLPAYGRRWRELVLDECTDGMTLLGTSALEVGVDIAGLSVAIDMQMPVDRMSLLQRIGRVGRSPGKPGLVIIGVDPNTPAGSMVAADPASYLKAEMRELRVPLDFEPVALRGQLKVLEDMGTRLTAKKSEGVAAKASFASHPEVQKKIRQYVPAFGPGKENTGGSAGANDGAAAAAAAAGGEGGGRGPLAPSFASWDEAVKHVRLGFARSMGQPGDNAASQGNGGGAGGFRSLASMETSIPVVQCSKVERSGSLKERWFRPDGINLQRREVMKLSGMHSIFRHGHPDGILRDYSRRCWRVEEYVMKKKYTKDTKALRAFRQNLHLDFKYDYTSLAPSARNEKCDDCKLDREECKCICQRCHREGRGEVSLGWGGLGGSPSSPLLPSLASTRPHRTDHKIRVVQCKRKTIHVHVRPPTSVEGEGNANGDDEDDTWKDQPCELCCGLFACEGEPSYSTIRDCPVSSLKAPPLDGQWLHCIDRIRATEMSAHSITTRGEVSETMVTRDDGEPEISHSKRVYGRDDLVFAKWDFDIEWEGYAKIANGYPVADFKPASSVWEGWHARRTSSPWDGGHAYSPFYQPHRISRWGFQWAKPFADADANEGAAHGSVAPASQGAPMREDVKKVIEFLICRQICAKMGVASDSIRAEVDKVTEDRDGGERQRKWRMRVFETDQGARGLAWQTVQSLGRKFPKSVFDRCETADDLWQSLRVTSVEQLDQMVLDQSRRQDSDAIQALRDPEVRERARGVLWSICSCCE